MKTTHTSVLATAVLLLSGACSVGTQQTPGGAEQPREVAQPVTDTTENAPAQDGHTDDRVELATFGAGCFWCTEAVLEQLDGVEEVSSGYMGGEKADPTYQEVCSGLSGHAEVVQVRFRPGVIAYDALLDWFWKLHDPTTLNRQGADVGTQYRSAIFVHSAEQRAAALASREKAQTGFDDPIVTEISDAAPFYVAEDYHQDYYRGNRQQGYCRAVIRPKLEKLGLDE